jgi:phosphohistidine phosphatase
VPSRRLLLIRHAKAAQGPVDVDRPLTDRGSAQAAALGIWLEQGGLVPDLGLVSPARRAVQTWERTAETLGAAPESIVDPRIYDNTVEQLLAAVRETPDDVQTVALVGHNPSVGELARALDDGEGTPAARDYVASGFQTGAVAVFLLAMPFAEVAPGSATLSDYARPGD